MQTTLNHILLNMQQQLDARGLLDDQLLIDLVNHLRPADPHNLQEIHQNLNKLMQSLLLTPYAVSTLQSFILRLISQYKQSSLYADTGILSQDGFWNQLFKRLGAHFLPLIPDATQLQQLLRRVFHQRSDRDWLDHIRDQEWQRLCSVLSQGHSNQAQKNQIQSELIKAVTVLSYRISGIGLYPEFIDAYPELTDKQQPSFHEIRALAIFLHKKIGKSAQTLAGHSTQNMTQHYESGHEIMWNDADIGISLPFG